MRDVKKISGTTMSEIAWMDANRFEQWLPELDKYLLSQGFRGLGTNYEFRITRVDDILNMDSKEYSRFKKDIILWHSIENESPKLLLDLTSNPEFSMTWIDLEGLENREIIRESAKAAKAAKAVEESEESEVSYMLH